MTYFNHPPSGFPVGIVSFLLDLFPPPFYLGDVSFGNNHPQCRVPIIAFVGTQMLGDIHGALDDDFLQHKLQLGDIMSIGSGHDEG